MGDDWGHLDNDVRKRIEYRGRSEEQRYFGCEWCGVDDGSLLAPMYCTSCGGPRKARRSATRAKPSITAQQRRQTEYVLPASLYDWLVCQREATRGLGLMADLRMGSMSLCWHEANRMVKLVRED